MRWSLDRLQRLANGLLHLLLNRVRNAVMFAVLGLQKSVCHTAVTYKCFRPPVELQEAIARSMRNVSQVYQGGAEMPLLDVAVG